MWTQFNGLTQCVIVSILHFSDNYNGLDGVLDCVLACVGLYIYPYQTVSHVMIYISISVEYLIKHRLFIVMLLQFS